MKPIRIVIILNDPYPSGRAVTNRIHYYARGFKEQGNDVIVLIPKPRNKGGMNDGIPARGSFEGIDYRYASGKTHQPENFFIRRWHDLKGGLISMIQILKFRPDTVIHVGNDLSSILFFKVVTLLTRSHFIQEKSELPFFNRKKNLYRKMYIKYVYRLFDGLIVISDELDAFFRNRIRKDAKIIRIPILTDTVEFKRVTEKSSEYLAYTGNLDDRKDGILFLLKAFAVSLQEKPDLLFYIIGGASSFNDRQKIVDLIRELGIEKNVELTGFVERNELVRLLCSASVLVLAKPDTEQTRYNFPSKLAEYLATGNPVLMTRIRATENILFDGKNVFLSEPGNPEHFAQKIRYITEHEYEAAETGMEGRKTAEREFDYRNQVNKIITFLNSLRNGR